ncbi:MAG: hypothetical protein ACOH2A_10410 [Sphingobacteriaceae bacterium]
MAGIKMKLKSKLNASSLLEVLVSMIIIVLVFSIAMGIHSNILRASLTVKTYRANAVLQEILGNLQIAEEGKQSFIAGGFRIDGQITTDERNSELKLVQLSIYDASDKEMATVRKVVYVPRNN